MTKYLLDTNVFIAAHNLHYGRDICPGFWEWLDFARGQGIVFSIEDVYEEISREEGDLYDWAKDRRDMFRQSDERVSAEIANTIEWARSSGYTENAVRKFSSCADCSIVAHARITGCTVVTHEIWNQKATNVKIPNACHALGVKCIFPREMLLAEKVRFVLEKPTVPLPL